MTLDSTLERVTRRIVKRSQPTRAAYLEKIRRAAQDGPQRGRLSCSNLAHGFAACKPGDKRALAADRKANVGIVSAYNDMLSAHQPLERFPDIIRAAAAQAGCVAQFAGGVPAMCDGVTQGQPGMELSLFSRDVIAMATAVALSHEMFDAALCLGVCDKIVPGLLIGALSFGHLPVIFVPGGPMPSGLPNPEKARIRERYAAGEIGREALLEAESASYHSPGTCTFYGTANSNQMLMELMGLHLPGAAFVNPGTPLRDALTGAAATRVLELTRLGDDYLPLGEVIDERAIVNGMVGLLATGGSTNHTMHLVAAARAAGILIDWEDFGELSRVVPLLARIYPNGVADVNHFHAAGGLALVIRELLSAGLAHRDVRTVAGGGLERYCEEPLLAGGRLEWRPGSRESGDDSVVRGAASPFADTGGLKVLDGNLGRAIIKTSAVDPSRHRIEAPARVFRSQEAFMDAYHDGELETDHVAVITHQGPQANGMPELHKLSPLLGVLQRRGHAVALVTDGRMSGASGKIPAALQVTPEASAGGALGRVRDGDPILVDANSGRLEARVEAAEWSAREPAAVDLGASHRGVGRELFGGFRQLVTGAEEGASALFHESA